MKNLPIYKIYLLLIILIYFQCTVFAQNDKLVFIRIYIGNNGDDHNDGLSNMRPLKTANRFFEIVDNLPEIEGNYVVYLYFLAGIYRNTSIAWKANKTDMTVFLEPAPGVEDYAVIFDGSKSKSKQFFKYDPSSNSSMNSAKNLTFFLKGFSVKNFCEGISFGDVKGEFKTSGHSMSNIKFSNIGSKYDQRFRKNSKGESLPLGDCVAVVRLSSTSNTTLVNSYFEHVENLPSGSTFFKKYGPGLLHSVYIATNSNNNKIESNVFTYFSGSPIRVRDQSNNNIVTRNTFSKPVAVKGLTDKITFYAVSEWYCNDGVKICIDMAKAGKRECPSVGTIMSVNSLADGIELFSNVSQSQTSTCHIQ